MATIKVLQAIRIYKTMTQNCTCFPE